MRLFTTIIIAGTIALSAGAASAQSADQGSYSGTSLEAAVEAASVDFFKLSVAGHTVAYETLDIEKEMQRLLNQACPTDEEADREAALSDCDFGPEFDFAVKEAQRDQLASLVTAQTEIVRLKAEAAVAEQRWTTAMVVQKANEAEIAAGIAVDADALAEVMSTIELMDDELTRLSILIEGTEDSTDAGLDQEVVSMQTRITDLEDTINITMENSTAMAAAMFTFCDNNKDISWCRMIDKFRFQQ